MNPDGLAGLAVLHTFLIIPSRRCLTVLEFRIETFVQLGNINFNYFRYALPFFRSLMFMLPVCRLYH